MPNAATLALVIASALVLAVSPLATAQQDQPVDRDERETIAKCLKEATSEDDQVRLRAIMVLGKYNTMATHQALANALDDSSARIRHTAAVALSEKRYLSSSVGQAMLRRLDDPDLHVRRVVSSHLPYLLGNRGSTISYSVINGQLVPRASSQGSGYPQDVKTRLIGAFADADAVVRKNMIDNYSYLRTTVPATALLPLLKDPDRDVRSLALEAVSRTMPVNGLLPHVAHLAKDKDPTIRESIAEMLATASGATAEELLDALATDADFAVSTAALYAQFRKRRPGTSEKLMARLDDPRMQDAVAVRVISALNPSNDDEAKLLLGLVEHRRSIYRHTALSILVRHQYSLPEAMLVKSLGDSTQRVRRYALALGKINRSLGVPAASKLVTSPYPDVRTTLPQLIAHFDNKQASPIIEELLFDETPEVRATAILEIAKRKLENWQDTLNTAFEVEDNQFCQLLARTMAAERDPTINSQLTQAAAKLPAVKANLIRIAIARYGAARNQIFRFDRSSE